MVVSVWNQGQMKKLGELFSCRGYGLRGHLGQICHLSMPEGIHGYIEKHTHQTPSASNDEFP